LPPQDNLNLAKVRETNFHLNAKFSFKHEMWNFSAAFLQVSAFAN
jgi:hypothetical protein